MSLTQTEEERLRRALSIIGAEATVPQPVTDAPSPDGNNPKPWWQRRGSLVAAASVLGAIVAGTVAFDLATDEPGDNSAASRTVSGPERIACSEQIFEGSIVSVADKTSKRRVRLEVRVSEWLKPSEGQPVVTFTAPSAWAIVAPPYKPGQHVFVMVQDSPRIQALVSRGREARWERQEFSEDFSEAKHTRCPAFWDDPDAGPYTPGDG